jgi:hypothetical protein
VIELNVVDRLDRGIGIRVGGKKRPLGVGIEFDRLLDISTPFISGMR